MSLTLKLLESNAAISKSINEAIVKQVAGDIQKNQKKVVDKLRALIPKWIRSQPEIDSLLGEGVQGSLNAQFGLNRGSSNTVVDGIVNAIVASVDVSVKPFTKITKAPVVEFSVQPDTFKNLLELELGKVTTLKGTVLEWLEWLLLLGNRQIIFGYSYKPSTSGRSGGGVMEGGSVFRVPPQFAGTADNNFITRALRNRDRELQTVLQGLFN